MESYRALSWTTPPPDAHEQLQTDAIRYAVHANIWTGVAIRAARDGRQQDAVDARAVARSLRRRLRVVLDDQRAATHQRVLAWLCGDA